MAIGLAHEDQKRAQLQLALAASRNPEDRATIDIAGFYAAHIMPRALMHEMIVRQGSLPVTGAKPGEI